MPLSNHYIKVAGYEVWEQNGSGEYDIGENSITATRKFGCHWKYSLEFALAMKGNVRAYGDILLQGMPLDHPAFPKLLYVNNVKVKPVPSSKSRRQGGARGDLIESEHNLIEVTYTIPKVDEEEQSNEEFGVWFEENIDFATEVMVIPGSSGLKFKKDPAKGPMRPKAPGEPEDAVDPPPGWNPDGTPIPADGAPPFKAAKRLLRRGNPANKIEISGGRTLTAPAVPPQRFIEEGVQIPFVSRPQASVQLEPGAIRAQQEEEEEEDDVADEPGPCEDVPQDVNVFIGTEDITLDFPTVPRWSRRAIRNLRGRVNSDVVLDAYPGQLLFMGATTQAEVNIAKMVKSRSLSLVLKWHQYGWNMEWKPACKEEVEEGEDDKFRRQGWHEVTPPLYYTANFQAGIRAIFA